MGIDTGIDLDALLGVRARSRRRSSGASCRARCCTPAPRDAAVRRDVTRRPSRSRSRAHRARARRATSPRRPRSSRAQDKLFVRDRLALLLDEGSFVEDGLLANALAGDLPADGVVTGVGRIDGRPVCVMANDSTVKAGSWGARTVEKIVRLTEHALRHELPVVYLVDSAGARITDQVELFPGRRGAGRIFANQVRLSGKVPQVCCLFGPSAAGGAYIPAFCDVVFMVEGNASMYLGSPRMAEVVIGEHVSLDEMGGARMHATVSGCGDNLCASDEDAIDAARRFLSYLPTNVARAPRRSPTRPRRSRRRKPIRDDRARRGAPRVRHAQGDRRARRRRLVLRAEAAVGARADHRVRPPRRRCRSASSPTTRCTSAACCSSTRPTRRRASSGCATRSTCRSCSSPTCPAS